jgi:hypothetical protein
VYFVGNMVTRLQKEWRNPYNFCGIGFGLLPFCGVFSRKESAETARRSRGGEQFEAKIPQ